MNYDDLTSAENSEKKQTFETIIFFLSSLTIWNGSFCFFTELQTWADKKLCQWHLHEIIAVAEKAA